MSELEALELALQIDAEMGPSDEYGWTFLSHESDSTYVVCFFDWPEEVRSPEEWEAMKERADW